MCNSGTYSQDYYDEECQICYNMPKEAETKAEYSNESIPSKSSNCNYTCTDPKITQVESGNPECLENYALFISNIGGNSVFILAIVSVVLSVMILLYFILKPKKS